MINNKRLVTDPKTALEKSIEMWEWLAEHPNKEKADFFAEKNLFDEDRPWAECYLCEYCNTVQIDHTHCEICPVDWTGKGNYDVRYRCEKASSPYQDWKNSYDDRDCAKYAKKVVELLKNSLNNLDKWQKEWYNKLENTEEIE